MGKLQKVFLAIEAAPSIEAPATSAAGLNCKQPFVWAAWLALSLSTVTAATRYVDGTSGCNYETGERNCIALDGPFHKIGHAVREPGAMSPGDTLLIRGGFYAEPIVLNKPMQIHEYNGPVTIGPSSPAPFDLVADRVEDNGLPLTPKWGAQITNPGTFPDPSQCPLNCFHDPGSYPCTGQYTTNDDLGCGPCRPHVNWFGATYTATITWHAHSCPSQDDDYVMYLFTPNMEGYVVGHAPLIQCEFDSDETIDHFTAPWWSRFHDEVNACQCELSGIPVPGCPGAQQMINNYNGASAIVTGLMGLDCAEGCGPELHPVWALTMNVATNLEDDVWVFFVRNWGNEGSCGHNQHFLQLPNNRYTVRLPWKSGARTVAYDSTDQIWEQWLGNGQTQYPDPTITVLPNQAVLITFQLDPPRDHGSLWDGELHLHWTK